MATAHELYFVGITAFHAMPYFSNASSKPRLAPGDLPSAIGVTAAPDQHRPIGMAFQDGHLGGWRPGDPLGYSDRPAEAVWRLIVHKEELEGRYVLRSGMFVELAEDAE